MRVLARRRARSAPRRRSPAESETPRRDVVVYESFPTEGTLIAASGGSPDDTGMDVEIVVAGDTGTMVSKAVFTAGNPEGDVMWGVDDTYLSRVVDEESPSLTTPRVSTTSAAARRLDPGRQPGGLR